MKARFLGLLSLSFLLFFSENALAESPSEILARKAVTAPANESAPAIAELRAMGPAGLDLLFQTYEDQIKHHIENPTAASSQEWLRLAASLDTVSQQKDSYLSRLYWYTDFKAATAAAQASGKPILSLRLLGKLNEEFSCANSRFFRTVLYSNQQVSNVLREHFVLHWESVRAAPRITIDFGDGRKLERTITGNSIHYVLDSNGQLIDGLPGLYGPGAFLRSLADAEKTFTQINGKADAARFRILSEYHRSRLNTLSLGWYQDTKDIGGKIPAGLTVTKTDAGEALAVMQLAVTKSVSEASILRSMMAGPEALGRISDEEAWKKIAALHAADSKLDTLSIGLIRKQTSKLFADDDSSVLAETNLNKLIEKLQASVALDTVRNEYLLHTKLHAWLASGNAGRNLVAFNEKVYSELFLTPKSDQWLGLYSADTYTALENGGVVK